MRLTDCFAEVTAYVTYFLRGAAQQQQVSFDQFRTTLNNLLADSQKQAQKAALPSDDYDLARFAICAWIDEAILSSSWEERARWQKEQLQRQYYGTTDAGLEFYDRLNALGLQQSDVREVYYLCLAMGFKGRYCHAGDELLVDQLKVSNLKLLTGSSMGIPALDRGELFPEAYQVGEEQAVSGGGGKWHLTPMSLAFLIGPAILFCLLFLTYRFILAHVGSAFLNSAG